MIQNCCVRVCGDVYRGIKDWLQCCLGLENEELKEISENMSDAEKRYAEDVKEQRERENDGDGESNDAVVANDV